MRKTLRSQITLAEAQLAHSRRATAEAAGRLRLALRVRARQPSSIVIAAVIGSLLGLWLVRRPRRAGVSLWRLLGFAASAWRLSRGRTAAH